MIISQKLNRCGSLWSALLCGSIAAACSGTIETPTEEFPPRQGPAAAAGNEDGAASARQTASASASTTRPPAAANDDDDDDAALPAAPAAEDDEQDEDVLPATEPAAAALAFESDVWPIFNAKCGPCHVSAGIGGQNIGSDDIAQALDDSRAFEEDVLADLEVGSMPPSGCGGPPGSGGSCITEEEFETIESWYAAGAPE